MTLLMSISLAGLVAATVYLFCLRPMRRGRYPVPPREGRGSAAAARAATDLDRELRRARGELVRLRRRQGRPGAPIRLGEALRAPVAVPRWRRYLPVNMSRVEQVVRVVAGVIIAVIAALVLPAAVGGGWRVGLAVLSGLVVVDLVVSGVIGHCPLHRFLRMPWEPRRRSVEPSERRTSLTPGAPADKVKP